ncbi:MAG TPA: dihydropteroate synthase [Urbifossiella sp.]|jgi:dihydropteroate synthase|nr:dihydropteroate synthase [Urbifossiella sp.]
MAHLWHIRDRILTIDRPLVVGILNITPDSFSDGGEFFDVVKAVERGLQLVAAGADVLDLGGESSRPRATPVDEEEELRRVVPVVAGLVRQTQTPLSIDTMKPAVARAALEAGASIVNDVSGLRDPAMIAVAAEFHAGAIVMHMQGTPATMQANPQYADVVREVGAFFEERLQTMTDAGVPREAICLDPGIGFGKKLEHNLALLANLGAFARFNRPICLGVSRKGFIGTVTGRPVQERLAGSLAVACFAAARGQAQLLRVHDVEATRDAVLLLEAIDRSALRA